MAEAYSVFLESFYHKGETDPFSTRNPEEIFENLLENRKDLEKFLDAHKEEPWKNIRYKPQNKNYYNYKSWLNSLASSKSKISDKKTIWDVINFGIKSSNRVCTICGEKGVKNNIVPIFPFERQIKNFFPYFDVNKRIQLCPLCQKICFYSFGNIYYNQSDDRVTIFFPVSDDYSKIYGISQKLKSLKIPEMENNFFSNVRIENLYTYYPFEYLYVVLFKLYVSHPDRYDEIYSFFQELNIHLISFISGRGLSIFDFSESVTRLDKILEMFSSLDNNINEINKKLYEGNRKPLKMEFVFTAFFNDLRTDGKKFADRNRLRESWTKILINDYKVDYLVLNNIVMSNIRSRKKNYKFINFYELVIKSILEVISMEETKFFESINNMGYALGKEAEEKRLGESILWEIFRTRTAEDFIETLVRTQLKMRSPLDLRKIEENKARWREIKAILLNGMANALFSRGGD